MDEQLVFNAPSSVTRSLPELLLPAGGFDAAVAAFEGGADGIYLGLRDFSARKQARNFDDLEYRRIHRLARDQGKRVYVAMNTVVTDDELPLAAERLFFLSRFTPDALIFQDWGLARLARQSFPEITLHASTQTAIQTDAAVAFAREAGATRIVLPRETSLLEVSERVASSPDMEFEIFVHGALCYSYSGLCLASGLELGRSGNRGECSQLCRSWYAGSGALKGEGYWFSCRDLDLSGMLGEIIAAGASSLKVEGRMKSPEYVLAVAKLYREALDRIAGKSYAETMNDLVVDAKVAFARAATSGWTGHHGGASIIDATFPGHRGTSLGRIVDFSDEELTLDLETNLGIRDGIQVVGDVATGLRAPSLQLAVLEMRDNETGRRIFEASKGMKVTIPATGIGPAERALLLPGCHIEKISSRALDRRKVSQEEYNPTLMRISAHLRLEGGGEEEARASIVLEGNQTAMPRHNSSLAIDIPFKLERARQPGGIYKALGLFAESGLHDFVLCLPEGEGAFEFGGTYAGPEAESLFIPPSMLKRLKNAAYEAVARFLEAEAWSRADKALSLAISPVKAYLSPAVPRPLRRLLVFEDTRIEGGMPFASPALLESGCALPEIEGWRFLPLSPLVAATNEYMEMARKRIRDELSAGSSLAVGLDAPHHLAFAHSLLKDSALAGQDSRLAFWIDIHFYVANESTLGFLAENLHRIAFAYRWIEAEKAGVARAPASTRATIGIPLIEVGANFNAPLFLSKACLIRHHLGKGHCPVPCGKRLVSSVRERDREYVALVEDCVSMLFRGSRS